MSTATETTVPILIVGAGPTGLTLANLLARAGVRFRLIDPKAGPVAESRALAVHAKTLELLDKFGLGTIAAAEGRRMGGVEVVRRGRPATTLSFFDAGEEDRTPYPFALIYEQSRTERLLLAGLAQAGGRVEWETSLEALTGPESDAPVATIRRPDGSAEVVAADWIVGADGAHSAVRQALGLSFAGAAYEQELFLADLELAPLAATATTDEPAPGRVSIEVTRGGFLGYFPMPGDRRFRLVGTLPPGFGGERALAAAELSAVIARHGGRRPKIARVDWASVYRTHHRLAERFRVGHVFLAGDAAHIHSPAGGQGMNTGIGDAFNLGWKLALVARGQAAETLLDSYEAERVPFARAILNGSDRGFRLVEIANPLATRFKIAAVPHLFGLLSRPRFLRRRLFWLVSQLWTSYRGSPAVAESPRRDRPRPGDRAPYGVFAAGPDAGTSLFARLAGVDHHLLLFEGPRPDGEGLAAAEQAVTALLDRYPAPVHLHPIPATERTLHERYGAHRPSLVLIRPDGHIAFRGEPAALADLGRCLDRFFLPHSDALSSPPRRWVGAAEPARLVATRG